MHRSRLGAAVIDCQGDNMAADATFWSKALGRSVDSANSDDLYISLSGPDEELNVLPQRADFPANATDWD